MLSKPDRTLILLSVGLIAILNILVCVEVLRAGNMALLNEGSFVESISAFSFIAAGAVLVFNLPYRKAFDKALSGFFAAVCLLLYLREVDVEKLNVPKALSVVCHGDMRDGLFVVIFLSLIGVLLVRYRLQLAQYKVMLKSLVSIVVLIGCMLLLAGNLCESIDNLFLEELIGNERGVVYFRRGDASCDESTMSDGSSVQLSHMFL